MRKLLYLLLIAFVAVTGCAKDDSKKVVARVGTRKITVGNFREAYFRVPPNFLPKVGGEEGRKQFLEDLVSKELLILEAYEQGLDKDEGVREEMVEIERQILLRDLYDREVIAESKVTEKELKQLYEERAQEDEIGARHILLTDSVKAGEVLSKVRAGEDFAELAKEFSEDGSTASMGGYLGFFGKETMLPPEFHEAVFALDAGEVSDVVRTSMGYHIIKVDEKRKRQLEPFETMKGRLESEVVMKNRMDLARSYLDGVKERYKITIDEETMAILAGGLKACFMPTGTSVAELSQYFSEEEKALVLASAKSGQYTISDYLGTLEPEGKVAVPSGENLEQLRNIIESEVITEPLILEARRTGIPRKKTVKRDLNRHEEDRIVDALYAREVRDKVTISAEETASYYEQHAQAYDRPEVIRFRKLLVYDKGAADSLAALARQGSNFVKLVDENSADRMTAARGGEMEVKAGTNVAIDSLARGLSVGQIAGPMDTGDGFLIIKLLERKPGTKTPRELALPYAERDLRREREEQGLADFLDSLREKYKPAIDEKALAEITLGAPEEETE
ncbi:MAG: peptidylprolyl isomerase [Candidatus Eiseniibacteriota bacterium]|nr:MAG: peptidylprolyl isomerase [Candidatus Eisenbacteria bacterium]